MMKLALVVLFSTHLRAVELTEKSGLGYDPSTGHFGYFESAHGGKTYTTSRGPVESQWIMVDSDILASYLKAGGKLKWPDNLVDEPKSVDKAIDQAVTDSLNNLQPGEARAIINDLRTKLKVARHALLACPMTTDPNPFQPKSFDGPYGHASK